MKIILASESKRRKDLLEKINLKFDVVNSLFDENSININHKNPEKYCSYLAFKKAEKISEKYQGCLVIGSDTIVYHKNKIIGKPKNKEDAIKQLTILSNSQHIVYTAVHIINKNLKINECFIDSTYVTFNKLNNKDIEYYIDNYQPYDKAGSYGIQDWSSVFVKKIDGCFYNVVGFPLPKFYKLLHKILLKNN
ncbi:MAG: septum formation protein Maf [Gammaproteobacteria bacterium]|nr:septum formation protein Maf [Gammaproteobacteria bacterium]